MCLSPATRRLARLPFGTFPHSGLLLVWCPDNTFIIPDEPTE